MQVNAHMDVDVVGVEQDDQVTVMLELLAPAPDAVTKRPPATVQVVLDRSGSMGGERLEAAKAALGGWWIAWTPSTASAWSHSTTRSVSSCLPGR